MANLEGEMAGGIGLLGEAMITGAVIGAVKGIVPKKKEEKKEEEKKAPAKKEEPRKDDGMFHLLS